MTPYQKPRPNRPSTVCGLIWPWSSDQNKQAIKALEAGVAALPKEEDMLWQLSVLYMAENNDDKALEALGTLMDLNPDYPQVQERILELTTSQIQRKAREEALRKAKLEAERKAKEEAERKARIEAARKAKEEAERKAKLEAERKAREEAAKKAKLEAERKAKEEAAAQGQVRGRARKAKVGSRA
jgi:membrane protein involved in colicin uptake